MENASFLMPASTTSF